MDLLDDADGYRKSFNAPGTASALATTELDRLGAGIGPAEDAAGIVIGCESASYKSEMESEGELLDES